MQNKFFNLENLTALCLLAAICLVRLSVAVSNVFFVLAYVLVLVKMYLQYKKTGSLWNGIRHKELYMPLAVCMLSFLPSVFFAPDVIFSVRQLAEIFIYRTLPLLVFTFALSNQLLCRQMLFVFAAFLGADCLVALAQVLMGIEGNGCGFGMHYLHLAGILSMLTPMLLVAVLEKRFPMRTRMFFGVILFCAVLGLGAGFSRGACIISLLLGLLVAAMHSLHRPKHLLIVLAIAVMVCAAGMQIPRVAQRLASVTNTTTNFSNVERLYMWRGCLAIAKDKPWSGCGFGNFQETYARDYVLKNATPFLHAHNNYFQVLCETGIVGFLGFMYLCFCLCFINLKAWLATKSPYRMMLWTGWLGFLLFGFIEYTFDHGDVTKIWWFVLGALLMLDEEYGRRQEEK